MDSRLEELKENLESAVEGMSSEQLSWHPPGKWCAAEVLEHLYLSYTGTIQGFERVMRKGKPLATRASMAHRVLTFVIVGLGYMPSGREAPAVARPRGLPPEKVHNEIGAKMAAMDAIIAQCEARFGAGCTCSTIRFWVLSLRHSGESFIWCMGGITRNSFSGFAKARRGK